MHGAERSGALLLAAALLSACLGAASPYDDDDDDDDDSDPAPFMIVLEHSDRWQCAASLVSQRIGLTSARCARGRVDDGALWALAAALVGTVGAVKPGNGSRRVARVALADGARRVARVALAGDGRDPTDPALDMALLELEAPFGSAARAQPILMQTDSHLNVSRCHAVRALPLRNDAHRSSPRARFRVCSLHFVSENHCATRVSHWAASHERLMCLAGDEMCERDLGGGVVCGGKLCGVLSAVGAPADCGTTLAAQSVARWRSFLHCAHTLRLCGSGPCASQCTERRLLPRDVDDGDDSDESDDDDDGDDGPADSSTSTPTTAGRPQTGRAPIAVSSAVPAPARTAAVPPLPSAPPRTTLLGEERASSLRLEPLEFEPNRADFKAAQTRTPRVRLKAGEYGDHVGDYAGEELPPPAPSPAPAVVREASSPETAPPPPPAAQLAAAVARAHRARAPLAGFVVLCTVLFRN